MTRSEALVSAARNLRAHKLRSALTMLGMIFGVGAVIAMLSIGAGAEREARAMLERLGLRNVLVRAADLDDDELKEVRKKSPGVSHRDAEALTEGVPGIRQVSPRIKIKPWQVMAGGVSTEATVHGVAPAHQELAGLVAREGRFLDPLDDQSHAQVCVIGPAVRRDLFGFDPAVGQRLKVDDVWLEVVGVLSSAGRGGDSDRKSVV